MRNGETKNYKGCEIKKISGKEFIVGGFITKFATYYEAKEAIDAADAEEKALAEVDNYVNEVLGGYC